MSTAAIRQETQEIIVDEVLPHSRETIWKALTSGALMSRWLMEPSGFEPIEGNRFTFKTTPAGDWDGFIRCQVLEVRPNERFVYAWKGGHDGNVGYGSLLDTIVAFTLSVVDGGTRVQLVHSGFALPKNDTAYKNMSNGWKVCMQRLAPIAAEQAPSALRH